MEKSPSGHVSLAGRLLILLALGLGICLVLVSFVVSPDRVVRGLSGSEPAAQKRASAIAMLARARVMGGGYLTLAVVGFVRRRRLAGRLDEVRDSFAQLKARGQCRVALAWRESRWEFYVVGLLTAVGVLLRWRGLGRPMGHDEAVSWLSFARKGFATTLMTYATNNHVFHNLLMGVSARVLGHGPAALRTPAFVAGCAMVPLTYLAGRALWNRPAGVFAAGVCAVSPYFIFFSTNARGYTILIDCWLMMLVLAPVALEGSLAAWAGMAVVGALGMFTVPVMVYPLLAMAGWVVVASSGRRGILPRALRAGILMVGLSVLLYTPAMVKTGYLAIVSNEMTAPASLRAYFDQVPAWAGQVWWSAADPVPGVLAVLFVAMLLVDLRRRREELPSVWVGVLLALPVVLFLQRILPFPRVLSFLFVGGYLSVGAGLWRLVQVVVSGVKGRAVVFGVIVGAVVVGQGWRVARGRGPVIRESGVCEDAPAMAVWLREHTGGSDVIARSFLSRTILDYYFELDGYPPGQLSQTPASAGRTLLVIDENRTLESAMADAGMEGLTSKGWVEVTHFAHGGRVYSAGQ